MAAFDVIIPARYAAHRLPGKPLCDIHGRPMIVRVAEIAMKSGAEHVWVATDDQRIADVCEAEKISVVMTARDICTGSDRVAAAAKQLGLDDQRILVNLQGDEVLLTPMALSDVALALSLDGEASAASLAYPLCSVRHFLSPNVVKVVCDQRQHALYFSRAPIPFPRDVPCDAVDVLPSAILAYGHVGLYAYRVGFLTKYVSLPRVSLECCENLEQLRMLYHGFSLAMVLADCAIEPGVDTPEDVARVNALFGAPV